MYQPRGPYKISLQGANNSGSATTVTFSEENGTGFDAIGSVSVANNGQWQTYIAYETTINFTNSGQQTFRLDFNGGVNVLDFTISVPTEPVFTAELGDQINIEGDTPLGLSVAANDPDGSAPVTFSDNGTLPPGLSIDANSGAISGTIAAGAASGSPYSVVITATDDDMETTDSSFTWTVLTPVSLPLCVNCGNQPAVTAFGRSFGDDDPFLTSGGNNFNNLTAPISGTVPGSGEEDLFQSEKFFGALSYAFPTGNGNFTVELYFTELYIGSPGGGSSLGAGDRIFDINVEGATENGIDLFVEYGPLVAATKTFAVTVADGILNVDLTASVDNGKLSGICITPTASFVPNAAPTVVIAPLGPIIDCEGDGEDITLTADANDAEQGDLDALIIWKNGSGTEVGTGPTLNLLGFTGSETYTAEVTDATPATAMASITVDVNNTPPALTDIVAIPTAGGPGTVVDLSTTPSDNEDDDMSLVVSWSSDLEGNLGTGNNITPALTIVGTHTITASVTDSCGVTTEKTVMVDITDNSPVFVQFLSPGNGDVERDCEGDGEDFTLNASFTDVEDDATNTDLTIEWFEGANPLGTGNPLPVNLSAGDYIITAVATDSDGNSTTSSSSLQVSVLAAPSFTLTSETVGGAALSGATLSGPGDITVCFDAMGVNQADGEHVHLRLDGDDNGQNPNQGADYIRFDTTSGCFTFTNVSAGLHTVSVEVAASDHTGVCPPPFEVSFIVADDIDPMAMCTDFTLELDATGNGSITAADVDGGSTDNDGIASLSVSQTMFTINDVGPNTVTLTVTDFAGNTATCDATVNVVDNVDPEALCQDIIIDLDGTGNASITGLDVDNGSNDVSGPVTLDVFPNTFDCSNIGDNMVTLTVTDIYNNMSTCQATVTVRDVSAPVIVCPADVMATSLSGNPIVIEGLLSATATDNCTNPPLITFERQFGGVVETAGLNDPFNVGTTMIVWTADDGNGNIITCNQMVTVNFTAMTGNDIVAFSAPGQIGPASINDITHTVDAVVSFGTDLGNLAPTIGISDFAAISPNSGDPQDFTNPVQYTVTAQDGTPQNWTVSIVVEDDTTDPTANCPADIVVGNDAGECGAIVNFTVTATDDRPGVTVVASPASGTFFGLGTTTVTVTATDGAGNTDECTFDVTVNDTEDPVVLLPPADITVNVDPGTCGAVVDFLADFSDNCPGGMLNVDMPTGSIFPVGTTTVTVAATDASGNMASDTFDVTVVDDEVPVISCPADIVVSSDPGQCGAIVNFMPTVSDNCPGVSVSADFMNGSFFPVGTTTVTATATDTSGNMATCQFDVTVEDNEAPVAICQDITIQLDSGGNASISAADVDGGSTDNCPGFTTGIDVSSFTSADLGDNTVTLTVTDAAGNMASCTSTVTVEDFVPEVLTVIQFVLVDASTNVDIFPLSDGMVIDITSLPTTNLNIRADATDDTESVSMNLSGALNKMMTENFAPYALYGDNAGNYNGQTFIIGNYNLSATPFDANGGNGNAGTSLSISFELTDQDPLCIAFDAFLDDSTDPTTCGGNEGSATIGASNFASPLSYSWSHDNSLNAPTATGLSAGSYSVIVTDANGCMDTVSFSLSDPNLPAVSLTPFAPVIVTDPAFTLTGGSPAGGTYSGTGVSGGMFDPSVGPGNFTITYTYTDGNGCTNSASQNIQVNGPAGDADLIVLDATTDTELFGLTDGLQINKAVIGETPLGIILNPDSNPNGVFFSLTGPINRTQAEGASPPFSLFGDIGVDVQGQPFPVGDYTLVASPNNGPTITVNFSVIDGPPGNQSPIAAAFGNADAATAFKVNFSSAGSFDPDGTIVQYDWNFGDGATSMQQNPMHTYATGGTYNVSLTVTDNEGATGMTNIQVEAVDPNDIDKVVSFTLVDADDDADIRDLVNNDVIIDSDIAGIALNIRANTDPGTVGSVVFSLTGALTRNWTESFAPYALYADSAGDYAGVNFPIGNYTLTATPYSGASGSGDAGQALTINFSVMADMLFARPPVNSMKVSPNPASTTISMEFKEPAKIVAFQVFDLTGRLVATVKGSPSDNQKMYQLNVLSLQAGTYFVRTIDANGKQYEQRMLIER